MTYCKFSYFLFGFEGRTLVLFASGPGNCLSFTFFSHSTFCIQSLEPNLTNTVQKQTSAPALFDKSINYTVYIKKIFLKNILLKIDSLFAFLRI